ncbi:hypothetical protein QUF64_03380 [Anaerolineales bacterium HSG6]|nr:hypothetical protein [Anaerolineales bacterium HSG6]MDM8531601.1 hypothetical protein [Anaerolineales bacterium HSG25]
MSQKEKLDVLSKSMDAKADAEHKISVLKAMTERYGDNLNRLREDDKKEPAGKGCVGWSVILFGVGMAMLSCGALLTYVYLAVIL